MQAIKKFNPYRGFRLATYAVWWIRAAIREFILRSWSLVRVGTTTAQRKLFYDTQFMEGRLSGPDQSLNRCAVDSGEEIQNLLADPRPNQEVHLLKKEATIRCHVAACFAMGVINERERTIISVRILAETPLTLESIGKKLSVSRERVRQLEGKALQKMRIALEQAQLI